MRRLVLVVGLLVGVPLWAWAADPVVSSVVARQLPNTRQVEITYDVADADGDSVDVSVAISGDGGATFTVAATTFSGDVGRVRVGTGKRVIWEAGVDLGEVVGDQYQARVTANDGSSVRGPLTVSLPGGVTMEMVWIEPGTFMMGSPLSEVGRYAYEGPQHQVTLTRGYYLGKYELTQGQWQAVMGTTPWAGQYKVQANPSHPAVYVGWADLQAFVHVLNQAAGDSLYRLPTEAEWEYACRAGTTTPWSFGDDQSQLGQYAWYTVPFTTQRTAPFGIYPPYAQPVGTKVANPWGLYDMHGNVAEWVQDWYARYSTVETDPRGPATGRLHVARGGTFDNFAQEARSACRGLANPSDRSYISGARLLKIQ